MIQASREEAKRLLQKWTKEQLEKANLEECR
jgi:hypothetical protein